MDNHPTASGLRLYCKRWLEPAMNKPEIGQASQEHWGLVFMLCLMSLEIGTHLGEGKPKTSMTDLVTSGLLVVIWLASQFRWSRVVSGCLRTLMLCWTILAVVVIVHHWTTGRI